jgi:restriction system protein
MTTKENLPTAKQMLPTLMQVLTDLGREGTVREIEELVAHNLNLSTDQLAVPHDESRTEFQYRLAWTRTYAKRDGLVTSRMRSRWELTQPKRGA